MSDTATGPVRSDLQDRPPDWFSRALAAEVEIGVVDVGGVAISYRAWGTARASGSEPAGVLLVHGGAAHSRWWDHIGPYLAGLGGGPRRVVALDLSGNGDSGHRDSYALDDWADEVLAVATATGAGPEPVLIGHSLGGRVTMTAANRFGRELGGIVIIDTPVFDRPPEETAARARRAFGPLRIYPTREDAIAHFRTVPHQPESVPAVLAHIAETSVRELDGGWAWKFDPKAFVRRDQVDWTLAAVDCRAVLFRAENGLVPTAMGERIVRQLGRPVPVVEIPLAAHHVMIDQPLALITALRTQLAGWDDGR
jgi:pimeloyl-ACP methyl ester carboxylesterase